MTSNVGFPWDLLLVGWLVSALLMFGLWRWHFRLGNAGIVDVGWAGSLAAMAVGDGLFASGYGPRRVLVAGIMAVWGTRLALHLLRDRVLGSPEDPRYEDLRQGWRPHIALRLFLFFQAQALVAAFLSVPVALAVIDPYPGIRVTEWAAVALWVVAITGEALADRQLVAFKANALSAGRVCDVGLWRYSRHPNYFFEWLVWVSYALAATMSPWGLVAWACPALMLYLLLRVTGIPMTEQHALHSRGDAYRHYQQTTSAFVPWFPREAR